MPIDTRDVIELVCKLSEVNDLKVTVTESLKGGVIVGCGAALGGVLLGPVGLAIGGTVGGIVAAAKSHGKFKSVVCVIRTMDPHKQRQLAELVGKIVHNLDATDAMQLITIVSGNPAMQQEILFTLINFLRSEMQMEIKD